MTKISESLIILNFIGLRFEGLFKILTDNGFSNLYVGIKRNIYRKLYNLGINEETLNSKKYQLYIETESSEVFDLLHTSIAKGIIDLYSFKQEYDAFFNGKHIEDELLKSKIVKFKEENKSRINELDWNEIKDIRNTVLAHNLRDKKNDNSIARNNLGKFASMSIDFNKCLLYFTQMNIVYNNLKNDFCSELNEAFKESINVTINK